MSNAASDITDGDPDASLSGQANQVLSVLGVENTTDGSAISLTLGFADVLPDLSGVNPAYRRLHQADIKRQQDLAGRLGRVFGFEADADAGSSKTVTVVSANGDAPTVDGDTVSIPVIFYNPAKIALDRDTPNTQGAIDNVLDGLGALER